MAPGACTLLRVQCFESAVVMGQSQEEEFLVTAFRPDEGTALASPYPAGTSSASSGHCIIKMALSGHYTLIRLLWALPHYSGALKALHSSPCAV